MNQSTIHPRIGVSSWSLNTALTRGDFTLLELPALCAAHGFGKLEVCHFHLPATDPDYLAEFKSACSAAGIELFTLLKDNGDITHADPAQREREILDIQNAIDLAAALGAARIRVIAGDAAAGADSLRLSAEGLLRLAGYANSRGVKVVTENWHGLLDKPEDVLTLFELTNGAVGLKLDFGNWPADRKYADLPKIAHLASCTHAKAEFDSGRRLDKTDFVRCLDITRAAAFAGPHILIFTSPFDEWQGLATMREVVMEYVA